MVLRLLSKSFVEFFSLKISGPLWFDYICIMYVAIALLFEVNDRELSR